MSIQICSFAERLHVREKGRNKSMLDDLSFYKKETDQPHHH